jgi:hypothetical protein
MTQAKYTQSFSITECAAEGNERRDYLEAVGPPLTPEPDD